jgi:putative sigma-54 modulation protein
MPTSRRPYRALPTDETRSVVQVKVSARHGHLNEPHQAEIAAKAEKLLHFFDRILMIEVTVDLAGLQKKVEIIASVEHHDDFVAHSEDPDVMAAVNATVDKIKQQIKHHKEKVSDHRRDPSHGGPAGIKP